MEDLIYIIYNAWQEYCKKSINKKPRYILMHWKTYEHLIYQGYPDGNSILYYDSEYHHYILFDMEVQFDRRMEENIIIISRTNLLDLQQSIRGCGDAIPLVLDENKEEGEDYGK